jgi:signal transduction histidine kinase
METVDIRILARRLEKAEAELQKCSQFAVASQYASSRMHDINNPLAAVANLVYLIKMQANDPVRVLEYADIIEQQVDAMAAIANQVLSFHREQVSKEFDLIDLVDSTLKLHQNRISKGNVELVRNYRSPARAGIYGAEILQVVSNLVLNALDAMPLAGGQLNVTIGTTAEDVHITFTDNGSGIHPDSFDDIFQPYKTTKANGTGLGLWMCKRIVDKHKGRLTFTSSRETGRSGTTFELVLPVEAAA